VRRFSKIKLVIAFLVFAFFSFGAWQLAALWIEPDSPDSIEIFTRLYSLSPDKPLLLDVYATQLDCGNGGFIPPEIDVMLSRRFRVTSSQEERAAIVEFLIGREARYRPGFSFVDQAESVASIALSRIDSYTGGERIGVLRLVEGLRRGRPLYKGEIAEVRDGQRTLDEAVRAYRRWWESAPEWSNRRRVDPLQGWTHGWKEPG
jgi:hypothetical protein